MYRTAALHCEGGQLRDEAIMLIFLPVMLFPNAPNNVRLCFSNIPVMLCTYSIILHFLQHSTVAHM